MNKSNRGVILQGRAREIVYNINKVFETEKLRANQLLRDLSIARTYETQDGIPISPELFADITDFLKASVRVTDRVVMSTGINKNTVTRIKREGIEAEAAGTHKICTPVRKPRGKSVVLDNCDLHALSTIITKLYLTENDIPSLRKIFTKAKTDLNYQGSMTTLRRILVEQLGYTCTRNGNQIHQVTIIRPNIPGHSGSDEDIVAEYLDTEVETPENSTST